MADFFVYILASHDRGAMYVGVTNTASRCAACGTRELTVADLFGSDLFDHLVGAGLQRRRHGDAERLGGPVVDDQLEPRRLPHWQLTRPCAAQDFCDLLGGARVDLDGGRA